MRRSERRLFRLNDELHRLRHDVELTAGELEMHRHLDDDARRDAAVSGSPVSRSEAHQTSRDVQRMEMALQSLRRRITAIEHRRERLLAKLGG